jgi:hypothetical protein
MFVMENAHPCSFMTLLPNEQHIMAMLLISLLVALTKLVCWK